MPALENDRAGPAAEALGLFAALFSLASLTAWAVTRFGIPLTGG